MKRMNVNLLTVRNAFIPVLLMLALTIVTSCGGDEDAGFILPGDEPVKTDGSNVNKNDASTNKNLARLEFPKVKDDGGNSIVLIRETPSYGITYSIEYDLTKRAQRWTCFTLTSANSSRTWNRNNWASQDNYWAKLNYSTYGFYDPFQPDPDLPADARTELEEYKGISYQRGHICASSDRLYSKDANEQTFYLSNILPQSKGLNTGIWQDMEGYVNGNTSPNWNNAKFRDTLFVCKGGTIDGTLIRTTTKTGLIVPKFFFMALLCRKGSDYKALGFWVEHTDQLKKDGVENYVVSIDQLERMTGIDFFCNLPDDIEEKVESASKAQILKDWNL